jgi:DMSO reductase family type II enzyme heme b subunit
VRNLKIRAIHNKKEVALYIQWDDPSLDPRLKEFTDVKESPAPPLPEHMQGKDPKEPQEAVTPEYPDAIAVQFPIKLEGQIPYFLNGDAEHPVRIWKWTTSSNKATETHATGLENWSKEKEEEVTAKGSFSYGKYSVIMKRAFKVNDDDIQFQTGRPIPIAFNIWDGYQEETGNKKSISSWFTLWLDE